MKFTDAKFDQWPTCILLLYVVFMIAGEILLSAMLVRTAFGCWMGWW